MQSSLYLKKTFFATPKKTYILGITRKKNIAENQQSPVFTYLVTDIGETLDTNRFDIDENNLKEMILMFNQFKGIKHEDKVKQVLENQSKRCKIQAIKLFQPSGNWKIDRWWSHDEKVHLGIEEEVEVLDIETLIANIEQTKNDLQINIDVLKKIETQDNNLLSKIIYKEIKLDEVIDFSVNTNTSRFTKSFVNEHKGDIPVYSASKNPDDVSYGYVADEIPNVRYLTFPIRDFSEHSSAFPADTP
jgi:type I restriction enzyme M protein